MRLFSLHQLYWYLTTPLLLQLKDKTVKKKKIKLKVEVELLVDRSV